MNAKYLYYSVYGLLCVFSATDCMAASGEASRLSGSTIFWFFFGINMGLLGLAFVSRRSSGSGKPVSDIFVSSSSYKLEDNPGALPEIMGWFIEQAERGGFSVESVIKLYNAIEEVVTYVLQTANKSGLKESITVNTVIRKGVGNVNITHTGPALEIHKFKPADDINDASFDFEGLELHLAYSQVDSLEYFARLSGGTSSFRLRRALLKG